MPRNSSGTYILPAGNPVVADTLIDVDWANPTMEDIGNALTGSLPRNGTAGMTGPLRLAADGVTPLEAVTVQQLSVATGGTSHFLPAGSYMEFAYDAIPAEYLYCDGRAVSRTTYSDLFTAIGVVYGTGDGTTTFNLPDRRGVFARGLDSGRNLDPARTLGSYQAGDNLAHTHGVTIANHTHTATTPAHAHGVNDPGHVHFMGRVAGGNGSLNFNGNPGMADISPNTGAAVTGISIQAANTPITVSTTATPAAITASGTESRPVNISVVVCIRAYGSYITGQLGTLALQDADDVLITGGTGTFGHLEVTAAPVHDNDVVRLIDIASAGNLTGLLSGDVQTIVIDNADPAVPVIRPQTNIPYGLVKLNGAGKVNPSQISLSDINYIGPWDASTGNTPVGVFVSGSMFQIDVAGVMDVITSSGVLAPQLCSIGSQIIYQDDSSPTYPLVGWYYQPSLLTGATANQIANVPSGNLSATDVQAALNELQTDIDTRAPNSFTQAGTGAVAMTVEDKLRQIVHVKDYDAVGDGVADDTTPALNAHTYANSIGASVSYEGLLKIAIQADAQIPMKTSTDFANCQLVILGGVEVTPSSSSPNKMFLITDDACPLTTVTGAVSAANLTVNSTFPTLGLFNGHGFALLECAYQVPDRDKTGTQNYKQAFKVNRLGLVSQPLSADISAFAAAITVTYRPTSRKRLKIENVSVETGAWNNQVIFNINRCNVKIDGFTMLYSSDTTYDNIHKLILIENSSDISIDNDVATGQPVTTTVGSYVIDIDGGADIYVDNMNALTGWGATGTNNVNGIHYTRSVLNRVDAHSSGHNMFVDDCDLHESGVTYGWGGGVISVTNSRLIRSPAIATRSDYGGSFFGSMFVSDCKIANNNTATYYLIDLQANPLGASTPVSCPNLVSVSNVARVGRASANNAEFIPFACKIADATSVVYAPQRINILDVICHNSWRFGLRLDFLNMEANPLGTTTRVYVDNCLADVAANGSASVLSTGILDYTNIKAITTPVRPNMRISDVTNLAISSRNAVNTEINVIGGSVNAIVTVAGAANRVRVEKSMLDTLATGFVLAPVGAAISGTTGFTTIKDCEFGAAAFDISNAAALQGNLIRVGATQPTLPGAATAATAFTGWKSATPFS